MHLGIWEMAAATDADAHCTFQLRPVQKLIFLHFTCNLFCRVPEIRVLGIRYDSYLFHIWLAQCDVRTRIYFREDSKET